MIVPGDANGWRVDLGENLARWTDDVVPKGVEVRYHGTYSPMYAWMYTYEKTLKARIERAMGRPLGPWERRLFGPDGAFSEGLSNAFLHGHHRDTSLVIRITCDVATRGLVLSISDKGAGFDVTAAVDLMRHQGSYFHVAGNGLRALVRDPEILASYEDGGRTLRLLAPLEPAPCNPTLNSLVPEPPIPRAASPAVGQVVPVNGAAADGAQVDVRPLDLRLPTPLEHSFLEMGSSGSLVFQQVQPSLFRVLLANAAAETLLARPRAMLIGRELAELWPAAHGALRASLLRALEDRHLWSASRIPLDSPGDLYSFVAIPLSPDSLGITWQRDSAPSAAASPEPTVADSRFPFGDAPSEVPDRPATDYELAAIFDAAPLVMLLLDEHGQITRANRAAVRMADQVGDAIVGVDAGLAVRCLHSLTDPRSCGFSLACEDCSVRTAIQTTLATGHSHRRLPASLVQRTPDGAARAHLLVSTKLLHTPKGRRVFVCIEDVTSRARVESSLSDTETRFRTLLEHTPAGIIIVDRTGRIVMANAACETLFGYSREQLAGLTIAALLPPVRPDTASSSDPASLGPSTVESAGGLHLARHRDGTTFPVEIGRSLAHSENGPLVMHHIVDARQRLSADRAKREFVSVVSHELRTPLTSIRGSLGLLAGGVAGPLPSQAQSMLAIALSNSDRLLRLINDILDMDKLESEQTRFNMRLVDIAHLAEQAVESNRGFAEQYGVTLRCDRPDAPLASVVDPDRILQVLANLLSNGVKYSPSGDAVVLAVSRHGGDVELAVSNHGPAIPEQFRSAIFQKFTQVDSSAERRRDGTGLGLAISKAIVERHGGTIGFRTADQTGTTFFFTLPARE